MEKEKTLSYSFDDTTNKFGIGTFVSEMLSDSNVRDLVKHEEFEKVAEELLDILRFKRYKKQMNDISQMGILDQKTKQYLQNHWFPKAKLYGLKYFAFVTSQDFYGNMVEKSINKDAGTKFGIEIQHFLTLQEGQDWLNSKKI
jgi:hypothetical protein